jgi:AraC family transcriptional regulator
VRGVADILQHLRGQGAVSLLTSEGLGWRGIEVERYRFPWSEVEQPPHEDHLVSLIVGRPFYAVRHRDGTTDQGRYLPGTIDVHPPSPVAAQWAYSREPDALQIRLEAALVRRVAEESGANPDQLELLGRFRVRDPRLERVGLSIKAELEEGALLGGRLYAETLATQLAVHLLREHSSLGERARRRIFREPNGGLSRRQLKRTLDYIGDNLSGGLSLAEIAESAGYSPHHFSRLFKESTGLSPHRYVIHRRVDKAKGLLTGTDLPAGQVARICGFSSQSHMGHHLRRLLGVTPASLRR